MLIDFHVAVRRSTVRGSDPPKFSMRFGSPAPWHTSRMSWSDAGVAGLRGDLPASRAAGEHERLERGAGLPAGCRRR